MAILKTRFLGSISGRVGTIVFKNVNGKTIVSSLPGTYKVSQAPQCLEVRRNFSKVVKFASFINSIPALMEIWLQIKTKQQMICNMITKINFHMLKNGRLTEDNVITPDGFYLQLNSLTVKRSYLYASLTFRDVKSIIFPAVLYLILSFDDVDSPFHLLKCDLKQPSPDKIYNVKIKMNTSVRNSLKLDKHPLAFFTLVGNYPEVKNVYWTSTSAARADYSLNEEII